jgi:hypothetical protein
MGSVGPTVFLATLTAVAVAAARFVFHAAAQLIPPVARVVQRVRRTGVELGIRMGLDRPTGLAQALAGLALVTLFVFTQVNRDVILAWTSSVNTAPIATFLPINESNRARIYYELFLDVAIPAFIYGLYCAVHVRRREGSRDGTAALAVLVGVIAIMVFMREWPYRTFHHRDFERVKFSGERCYVNGESGDELLILCPGGSPPRNHVIRRDDPNLERLGIIENVFRGMTPAASDP